MVSSLLTADKKTKVSVIAILVIVAVIVNVLITISANAKVSGIEVKVNDKAIAVVKDKQQAEKIINELLAQRNAKYSGEIPAKVTYKQVKVKPDSIVELAQFKADAAKLIATQATGYAIKINGQVGVVLADEAKAKEALAAIKRNYSGGNEVEVNFNEKVEIAQAVVSPADIVEVNEAVNLLQVGRVKTRVHTVAEGENLWDIAKANALTVEKIAAANPDINIEKLKIDQEIFLVAPEPLLNAAITVNKVENKTIPFKTVVERDRNMDRNKQKVKQEGSQGEKEVTYAMTFKNGKLVGKAVLAQKVLKEPVNQVVVKGAKHLVFVASRGDGSSFAWPHRGRINSPYGSRWGRRHEGIDIDGNTGNPVGASAAGKVIQAGYDGAYGKLVILRHSNGYTTYYAHLSDIDVRVGEQVEQGQLIGKVGNTGRSTGPHLHFEIRKNGSPQNPMSYL